jgi:predicted nucleic acid-binding protein
VSLVIDASMVVAALIDGGRDGAWAESMLLSDGLYAPALMPVETASILRRACLSGEVSRAAAAQAHADLLDLRVDLLLYGPFGPRVWELRSTLTEYDAWYVAVAEALESPLATLDLRMSRAPGPRCAFRLPPG